MLCIEIIMKQNFGPKNISYPDYAIEIYSSILNISVILCDMASKICSEATNLNIILICHKIMDKTKILFIRMFIYSSFVLFRMQSAGTFRIFCGNKNFKMHFLVPFQTAY